MLLQNLDLSTRIVIEYVARIDSVSAMLDFQGKEISPKLINRKNSMEYQINQVNIH